MFRKINFKRIFIIVGIFFVLFSLLLIFTSNQEGGFESSTPVKTLSKCYVVPAPEPWVCTGDCSGHQAGYNWAKQKSLSNPSGCDGGKSLSFREGCEFYVQEQMHYASYDMCYGQYE